MNEQELNKKLNKFADFQRLRASDGNYHWFDADENIVSPIDEEDNVIWDMNACFKWLVPRLVYFFEFRFNETLSPDEAKRWRCVLFNKGFNEPFESYGDTPALALCLAIEKLIDEKT